MPNPYTLVDDMLEAQLKEFTALTAVLPAERIHFSNRPTDVRKWLESADTQPALFVYPGRSDQSPFANAQAHDQTRTYELVLDVPGTDIAPINEIIWQVYRAIELLMRFKDAAGDALTQPDPLKWGSIKFREFRMAVREGVQRIQYFATLDIELLGDITAIAAGSLAPTFKRITICRKDANSQAWAFLHFDQQMTPTTNADLQMEIRDGAGNAWTVVPPAVCPGGSVAMVELAYPPSSEAGTGRINTYGGGTPALANLASTPVADVTNQAVKVTIVTDA